MNKVIAIVGPTASGKTTLSIKLAKKFRGEIISADSRQIYRSMDIGTGKATKKELRQIPHHLIDILTPRQSYTVAHFLRDARRAINKTRKAGRLPILVGGTGHYIHALLTNSPIPQIPPNSALRKTLGELSAAKLFTMLKKLDPQRAKNIDAKNPRRLIRAIEIAKFKGKELTLTLSLEKRGNSSSFTKEEDGRSYPLILGIQISKEKLRRNINTRVDQMFRAGLVHEVRSLIKQYGRRKILSETIGYREALDYLDGKLTSQQTRDRIKKNTWQFVKHQYNWLRRLPVVWIKTQKQAENEIKKFLG